MGTDSTNRLANMLTAQVVPIAPFGNETLIVDPLIVDRTQNQDRISRSALSWGAIVGGAVAAASLWMILMILGAGLGLSSVSPFVNKGISATTFGISTVGWLVFSQIAASAMGGYLAGRVRTRRFGTPPDEVRFRDITHGFLAWAVAALITAIFLTSVIASVVSDGIQASITAPVTSGALVDAAKAAAVGHSDGLNDDTSYFVDSLFRTGPMAANSDGPSAAVFSKATRIFTNGLRLGALPVDDVRYGGQLVAAQTGLSQSEAQTRVADTFARLQSTRKESAVTDRALAEQARTASATAAIWLFLSLLFGAVVAGNAAMFGGRRRDVASRTAETLLISNTPPERG
ncbi:hypothetical protein [uncultured Thiodictyon sp.]|uniref:hypothetical protein n=1 Tax=uncultured Thiodictyon sp. TaxID=1846217 RepID=UPI0025FA0D1D|nr:hypothetical protein [uncultured Thiodictyon sp.]